MFSLFHPVLQQKIESVISVPKFMQTYDINKEAGVTKHISAKAIESRGFIHPIFNVTSTIKE